MGIKLRNTNDFKFDITVAFVIYAFLIVMSLTYISIFFFTKIATKEFQEKVKIAANNIIHIYKTKENIAKQSTLALSNSELISGNLKIDSDILASIFKIFLSSNIDFKKIKYLNRYGKGIVYCEKKRNRIFCDGSDNKSFVYKNLRFEDSLLTEEKFIDDYIEYKVISPLKNAKGYIVLESIFSSLFNASNNFYNLIVIDKKGKVVYSSLFKATNLYDIFSYLLADNIKKANNEFVTDDIYVVNLNDKYKLIFVQNKKILNQTNSISQKLAMIMIAIAFLLAIPLGVFFSKPLYNFYKELDKRVQEEIKKVQEKDRLLMHQSKLAAFGEMLGNIAHQWRHPLTRLSLLLQNLEMAYNCGKLDKDYFEKIKIKAKEQIDYMSQTIDDFINFFKKDTQKEEFCPYEIIKHAIELMEGRIKQNRVDVKIEVIKKEKIYGYKGEFSQVILNIINNAIDAFNEKNIQDKKIVIRINNKKIEIEDNAGGVPKEIQDKIFEPYFTTKFQSQGTGIGLYMSKVIITQHFDGKLYTYNSKNGAVFVIEV